MPTGTTGTAATVPAGYMDPITGTWVAMPTGTAATMPTGTTATMPTGTATVPTPVIRRQEYKSFDDLNKAICALDAAKFCRGGDKLYIQDVCNAFTSLPDYIRTGSSLDYACKADWAKVCSNAASSICASD
jgi:hypothetical protein